jgi:hypothetical protein
LQREKEKTVKAEAKRQKRQEKKEALPSSNYGEVGQTDNEVSRAPDGND